MLIRLKGTLNREREDSEAHSVPCWLSKLEKINDLLKCHNWNRKQFPQGICLPLSSGLPVVLKDLVRTRWSSSLTPKVNMMARSQPSHLPGVQGSLQPTAMKG